ncbi:MAG: beta-N-acetylhexosaminidase [Armatimonadetes bacterium]|nr:beta-N-acetylhexosaminidase [Armatimonadota bacterium]
MPIPQTPVLNWSAADTPPDLAAMLRCLGDEYSLRETGRAEANVRFVHEPDRPGYAIGRADGVATVRYGPLSQAGRAVGSLLSGLDADMGSTPAFETLGILLDCGHNATVTSAHFRKWLRRLALLGYNVAMVYTEGGYRLPDEPAFGYQRGAYTADEMRELDQYAGTLGVEMIGSIQALGHLEQVLKWPPYAGVRDTEHTLLVGDPGTAALVDKMVAFWAETCASRRLHVGMDETYDLGRGRYLDLHGTRRGLDLYVEHLRLVAEACARHGVRPMVWSDVLFRLAGGATHYDQDSRIPDEVRAALPPNVDLAYWDYYSPDAQHYRDRIEAHRALGYEPVMASGIWSWPTPWHDWRRTEQFGGACVQACRDAGLREMIFTMWSDDGAYWDVDSALAGVTLMAEHCHGDGAVDDAALARRFAAVCGSDLAAHRAASRLNDRLQLCSVLWDDPLQAMYLRHASRDGTDALREASAHYREIVAALQPHVADTAAGDLGHAALVAQFVAAKTGLAARLFDGYDARDRAALQAVMQDVPAIAALTDDLAASFRRRWLACCQPFGLEVIQIRFAGQAARYRELARRLGELLAGDITSIPELDEAARGVFLPARSLSYRHLASGARVF